jgi:hypothetical protein
MRDRCPSGVHKLLRALGESGRPCRTVYAKIIGSNPLCSAIWHLAQLGRAGSLFLLCVVGSNPTMPTYWSIAQW